MLMNVTGESRDTHIGTGIVGMTGTSCILYVGQEPVRSFDRYGRNDFDHTDMACSSHIDLMQTD